ncbi:hypothetical protein KAU11_07655 [Candidatus Babeliales bacterium]|nr:hypothetical protein [Candidatus Babeliales bacterium]
MDRENLVRAWLIYKEDQLNSMMDYSENDDFIEDAELTDEEWQFLQCLPLKVSYAGIDLSKE